MIVLTRLNGQQFVVNAELVRTIEERPDTIITLLSGERLLVKEPMDIVVRKAIEYGQHLRRLLPPD